MAKNFYIGVLVPGPLPESYSYDTTRPWSNPEFHKVLSLNQRLEITEGDARELANKMIRDQTMISCNHLDKTINLGKVSDAWVDPAKGLLVKFALNPSAGGADFMERMLQSGYIRELSLKHNHTTMDPVEVSICNEGCRPGTSITKLNEPSYNSESASPVIISASKSTMLASTSGALATIGNAEPKPAVVGAAGIGGTTLVPVDDTKMATEDAKNEDKKIDPLDSAMNKLLAGGNLLTKAEKTAILQMAAEKEKLKTENKASTDQKTALLVDQLSQLLKNFTGKDLPYKEDDAYAALQAGDTGKFEDMVNPVLVAANRAAMERYAQAPARGAANQDAPDPEALKAYQEYYKYKQSKPSTSLPAMYHNSAITGLSPVVVAANREQMTSSSSSSDQPVQTSAWSGLPNSRYRAELDALYSQSWGMGFKPKDMYKPEALAALGAPNSSASYHPYALTDLPPAQRQRQ